MTVWAGVDIGNATTEVVLCSGIGDLDVLCSARVPTRGGKGSLRAIDAAAQLVRQLSATHGLVVDRAAFAPTPPVTSVTEQIQLQTRRTGRLYIATRSAPTTAGDAVGVGVPVPVGRLQEVDRHQPVVACATRDHDYRDVAGLVNAAIDSGRDVAAVVTTNDEAVLVSNRLLTALPVVDGVEVAELLSAALVAVEVRQGFSSLQRLTDPYWLVDAFSLRDDERPDATLVADQLYDSACAVVCLHDVAPRTSDLPSRSLTPTKTSARTQYILLTLRRRRIRVAVRWQPTVWCERRWATTCTSRPPVLMR